MKFFVTGATGFIGGSVAHRLLADGHHITGLTRSEENAEQLRSLGIVPVLGALDDVDVLTSAARAADAVIHCADADHAASVDTLLSALEGSGKLFIHTSGSSIVADDAQGEHPGVELTEDTAYTPVPFREARVDMVRRVREAGINHAIRSVVICPSMIYGEGRGLHPDSDQLPKLTALSRQMGAGLYLGKGLARYSNVHIDDVVALYALAIAKAPAASLFFASNGEMSFKEIAENIARVIGQDGKTHSLDVEEVTQGYGLAARYGLASNSRVIAANARRLGWAPAGISLAEWFQVQAS
ncbi:MAG: NAD-dependent epimerase/dehydratase family protein [Sphingomonas sp.]|jgi:nucleoside-diphosphate-sugar epimerase|uniref:NAD-dependent epimerase/dehydratase family protein n=1 Tax=Sphingomonas sp. TaxID=28214 RepID=UPI003562F8C1